VTSHPWDAAFADLQDSLPEYYPGSNKPIIRHPNRHTSTAPRRHALAVDDTWDAKPRKYVVNGVETEFFTVGQLARALGREAVTIRKWEREGTIPVATFQVPGREGDHRGRRRLYTRQQVEGMVRIAHEEGVLHERRRSFATTEFKERVLALFKTNTTA
jgi:hypothetical protein